MKEAAANIPASVLARLKNIADREHLDYNFILIRYTQERFLARLAASAYAGKFVLKGGFLLLAYNVAKARPTKDIDFLGIDVARDKDKLKEAIMTIVSITLDDGIIFLKERIKAEVIKEEAEYDGVRITVSARIGKAKTSLRIDFGFGDVVTHGPLEMSYPTLLKDDEIRVMAYSKETIVSEKFEAIVKLTTFNTRLKDFYDLLFLSREFSFDGRDLQKAIKGTFERRGTSLEEGLELLESDFSNRNEFERLWQAFKQRTNLEMKEGFSEIFRNIQSFLVPVARMALTSQTLEMKWNPSTKKWETPGA